MGHKLLITTSSFSLDSSGLLGGIKNRKIEVIVNPHGRKLTEKEVGALIEEFQPLGMIAGVEPLNSEVLKKAKRLRVISRCGIGLDSIDLGAAKDLGILVTNTPDAPTISVAELTLGMILALMRGIHLSDSNIRKGSWDRPMGSLLNGKTVGVIGCGRIGTYVAKLLRTFGSRVLGCDLVNQESDSFQAVSLTDILKESDVITLHINFCPDNHHFLSSERINQMKHGAFVVNTSRGGLVDEVALFEALKSGHLGGAAIDCFEEEPYNGPLKELNNVLLTAHIGSYAKEGRILMEREAVNNLIKALRQIRVIH